MKYQLILESEREVALQDIRSSALIHGIGANKVTFADQTHIPRTEVLYVLQTDDMIGFYEDIYGEDSYDKLSEEEKETLKYKVKKGLGYGLGEAWSDYMRVAIELAEEN